MFGHEIRLDKTKISGTSPELKFKGKRQDDAEQHGLARHWNTSRREWKDGKKLKRKDCGKKLEAGDLILQSI